jgi:hypothetical protein
MKLNLVVARTGILWVKLGIQTFFKQPIALTGLFFMYMAVISIASLIPLLGSALALGLLPAATLGLMAASREATKGNFPMPSVLVSAFRAGQQRLRAMLLLGLLYALGFLCIMGISAIFDGGQFARLYLVGGKITREMVNSGDFQSAMWVSVLLYLPLSLLFWHAPALVHWHGEPPMKSLFFSLIACWRNKWALTLYGVTWLALFMVIGFVISLTAGLMSSPEAGALIMMPTALVLAAMFFTSIYFTFRDSFVAADGEDA